MHFNHNALLGTPNVKYRVFEKEKRDFTFDEQDLIEHTQEWVNWIKQQGDTINVISIMPFVYACGEFHYHCQTVIVYCKIGDPATGRI